MTNGGRRMKIGDVVRNELASPDNPLRYGIVIGKSGGFVDILSFITKTKVHKAHYDIRPDQDFLTVIGHVGLYEIIKAMEEGV